MDNDGMSESITPRNQLKPTDLGEMELQGVVSAQTNIQPCLEEIRQGVPLVREEQSVIAQRTHSDANLLQIEEIL